MKKTLSVLLSLLMVVSCMTCLFTMPASAVETPSTEVVENLPENLLTEVEGSNGKEYSFNKETVSKEFYQLDVVVTADETATAKTFYPTLLNSAGTSMNYYSIVGVRYSAADPTNVETAYNLKGLCLGAAGTAANNVDGTYTYTYIVSPGNNGAKGISFPDDVTIGSANMFALKDTQWNDFFWEPNKVFRYMVKEGNNVFQRFYGYRPIGAAATLTGNGTSVGANIDGNLYNLELKAGQTYAVDYDIRLAANTANAKKFPGMDMFDTEMFDVRAEYKALRDRLVAAGQFPEDEAGKILGIDEYRYVAGGIPGTGDFLNAGYTWANATSSGYYTVSEQGHMKVGQVIYDGNRNRYSNSNWIPTGSGNTTLVHRANTENIAKLDVYTSTGSNQGGLTSTSSQVGGSYTWINKKYNSQWLDATYTLTAPEYKTLDEQYVLVTKITGDGGKDNYYLNATAEEVDGKTVYTYNKVHDNGARIIPHGEVGHAGVAIANIFAGAVYDFDNFEVKTVDNSLTALGVKGKDSNGNLKDIHANDDTTKVTVDTNVDLVADTFTATFSYDATREAYGEFVGWYNGDTLISTEKTAALPYSAYKADPTSVYAVVEYENYMGNVGGFESYTKNNTNLMPELETITFSDGSTRQQHAEGPTGEYWGQWEWLEKFKLPSGISYDPAVAEFITENGANVAINGKGVIAKIGEASINNKGTGNVKRTASPYKGNNMGYMNEATFIAIKAIEGLTPGKTYMLSFYTTTLNATGKGIEAAAVTNTPLDFNCLSRGVAGGPNRPDDNKILGYAYTQGTHSGTDDDGYGIWDRIVLYFTASDDTEYFWMRTPNSQTFVDEFVCKEFNEINVAYDTNWDFEDGKAISDGLNNMSRYDSEVPSTYQVVDNDTGLDKLGSKYLKLTSAHESYNAVNINFNYNSTDKYVISFDMKVMKYATGANNKIQMFASKLNNMGYYQTSHLATNALASQDGYTLTRAYEDGKYFQLVEAPTSEGQFMFTTLSTTNDAGVSVYGENDGGAAWDEWTHYEIEIDPSQSSYSGPATFGIFPQGIGWEIGFDNFKVEKFSADVIAEFDAKFAPTYAYNIRSASSGFKQGLRFKSSIDLVALGLIENDSDAIDGTFSNGTKIVEYGTIASRKSDYEDISATNKFQFRQMAKDVVKDASKSYVIPGVAYNKESGKDIRYSYEDGVVTYTGVLVGIDTANIATDFVVRAYVILEDANGVQTTVYGDIQTLSMITAATAVVANPKTPEDAAAAQEVIDAYNAANKQ